MFPSAHFFSTLAQKYVGVKEKLRRRKKNHAVDRACHYECTSLDLVYTAEAAEAAASNLFWQFIQSMKNYCMNTVGGVGNSFY